MTIRCSRSPPGCCKAIRSTHPSRPSPATVRRQQLFAEHHSSRGETPYGECSVTPGQTVTILGAQPAALNGTLTVASTPAPNTFTFASAFSGSSTAGGYLTSNNVQNIFTSYAPQNLDGTTAGKTKSFSDFVDTTLTVVGSQTHLQATTLMPIQGSTDVITATITAASAQVPGPGSMPTGTTPAIPPSTVNFFTGTSPSLTPIANCTGVLVTATSATTGTAPCSYLAAAVGPVSITAQYADAYHTPSSASLNLNVQSPFDAAIKLTFGSTTLTYPGTTTETVCITPATSAAATGTVKLYDGSNLLTTLTLGSNGCVKWEHHAAAFRWNSLDDRLLLRGTRTIHREFPRQPSSP